MFALGIAASTSGGHFNPAVTIVHVIFRGFPVLKALRWEISPPNLRQLICWFEVHRCPNLWRLRRLHASVLPMATIHSWNGWWADRCWQRGKSVHAKWTSWCIWSLYSSRSESWIHLPQWVRLRAFLHCIKSIETNLDISPSLSDSWFGLLMIQPTCSSLQH